MARFAIQFHPEVARDLRALPRNMAARILSSIEARLSDAPDLYAERLRKSLRGYWKLRIGDYRVVFEMVGDAIRVFGVHHRRDVYERIVSRLSKGWPQ